jgi:hypothetical protein
MDDEIIMDEDDLNDDNDSWANANAINYLNEDDYYDSTSDDEYGTNTSDRGRAGADDNNGNDEPMFSLRITLMDQPSLSRFPSGRNPSGRPRGNRSPFVKTSRSRLPLDEYYEDDDEEEEDGWVDYDEAARKIQVTKTKDKSKNKKAKTILFSYFIYVKSHQMWFLLFFFCFVHFPRITLWVSPCLCLLFIPSRILLYLF